MFSSIIEERIFDWKLLFKFINSLVITKYSISLWTIFNFGMLKIVKWKGNKALKKKLCVSGNPT